MLAIFAVEFNNFIGNFLVSANFIIKINIKMVLLRDIDKKLDQINMISLATACGMLIVGATNVDKCDFDLDIFLMTSGVCSFTLVVLAFVCKVTTRAVLSDLRILPIEYKVLLVMDYTRKILAICEVIDTITGSKSSYNQT